MEDSRKMLDETVHELDKTTSKSLLKFFGWGVAFCYSLNKILTHYGNACAAGTASKITKGIMDEFPEEKANE